MFDDPEFNNHIEKISPLGWVLNPQEFIRVGSWNMLMFQLVSSKKCLISLMGGKGNVGDLDKVIERQSLFSSFVLSYAKCFTSVGKNQIKLDANDVLRDAKHMRSLHDEILIIRHKLVAHNDTSRYARTDISVLETADGYQIKHTISLALPEGSYEDWLNLIEYVEQYSIGKLNKALDSLERQLGKPIGDAKSSAA